MSTPNKLLYELHALLAKFINEENILGPHKALDERFTNYVIRIARELKELRDYPPEKIASNEKKL